MPLPKPTFTRTIEPEDLEIEGNASAIDEATDREIAASIRMQLTEGNQAAWCVAMVRATLELDGVPYVGIATCGACSYESEKALWDDMGADLEAQAMDDLITTLHNVVNMGKAARSYLKGIKS